MIKLTQNLQQIFKTHYQLLKIPNTSTKKQIKQAFYQQAKLYHPDHFTTDKDIQEAQQKMIELNQAYSILYNEESRKKYDAKINPNLQKQNTVRDDFMEQYHRENFHFRNENSKARFSKKQSSWSSFQNNEANIEQERIKKEKENQERLLKFKMAVEQKKRRNEEKRKKLQKQAEEETDLDFLIRKSNVAEHFRSYDEYVSFDNYWKSKDKNKKKR